MASSSSTKNSQPKILELIVEAGKKAFDPNASGGSRELDAQAYEELISSTETWILLPALNTLIKPSVLPPWLRQPLMQSLTLLPLRSDGVRATMEFVFSVHPSNSGNTTESATPQKQGASITHEAVAVATKLLSSVPASMSPEVWFEGISGQLFSLIDGDAGPDLARTAAQIVGFGILGKKQTGAPGSPGWNVFVQPLLQDINPTLAKGGDLPVVKEEDEIIDLSQYRVLVPPPVLRRSLHRFSTLVLSNPSPGLCRRLLKPVSTQAWVLASWPSPVSEAEKYYCKPARDLLRTYLRLFGSAENVLPLIHELLSKGSSQAAEAAWKYRLTGKGEIEVVQPRVSELQVDLNWNEIEDKSVSMVKMLISVCTAEEVSSIFLSLLRRWIETAGRQDDVRMVDLQLQGEKQASPIEQLVEVTILQKLMEIAPEKLVSHFDQLLELICEVLKADGQSQLADDLVAVALSLLNLVVTAPTFKKTHIKKEEIQIIESSLDRISRQDRALVSPTARNLGLLFRYRDEVDQPDEPAFVPSNRQIEDRKTYNLAMSYITGSGDNPPPVVSEGLNLLSGLILAESSILDIPAIVVLMSNLLAEKEDYINLRVVKIFTQLANKHPKSTVQELLDHYLDAREKLSTDVRLRFGEALLQVIERLGDTFTGDIAQQVCETLLSIAGRRGYRPKTMKKQARDEKLRNLKKDADDVDMEDKEDMTEDERANNDVLAQIVQGWESKRGSEDVRMRASALSIFGSALEINIGGVGPTLVSASVDLCINVLAMERELETAILRRAAILNVLGFVRALDTARQSGRKLGFGLTDQSRQDILRTLKYVSATDNDGLVRQYAQDVVESLENWQMSNFLPEQNERGHPELTSLAGLHVNPAGTLVDASGCPRPRIEEVE